LIQRTFFISDIYLATLHYGPYELRTT